MRKFDFLFMALITFLSHAALAQVQVERYNSASSGCKKLDNKTDGLSRMVRITSVCDFDDRPKISAMSLSRYRISGQSPSVQDHTSADIPKQSSGERRSISYATRNLVNK